MRRLRGLALGLLALLLSALLCYGLTEWMGIGLFKGSPHSGGGKGGGW